MALNADRMVQELRKVVCYCLAKHVGPLKELVDQLDRGEPYLHDMKRKIGWNRMGSDVTWACSFASCLRTSSLARRTVASDALHLALSSY